jgi:hypothetical protein
MLVRGKFAVVHSAYECSFSLLALMESAGWLLNRLHALSWCCVRKGFANHSLDLYRHHQLIAWANCWKDFFLSDLDSTEIKLLFDA